MQKACSLPSVAPLMQNLQQTSEPHLQLSLSVIDSPAIKEPHQEAGAHVLQLHHTRARHLTDVQPTQHFCFFKACRTLSAVAQFFGQRAACGLWCQTDFCKRLAVSKFIWKLLVVGTLASCSQNTTATPRRLFFNALFLYFNLQVLFDTLLFVAVMLQCWFC